MGHMSIYKSALESRNLPGAGCFRLGFLNHCVSVGGFIPRLLTPTSGAKDGVNLPRTTGCNGKRVHQEMNARIVYGVLKEGWIWAM